MSNTSPSVPIIWQLSCVQFDDELSLFGTLLKNIPYKPSDSDSTIRHAIEVARTFIAEVWDNQEITIRVGNQEKNLFTDERGIIQASFKTEISNQNEIRVSINGIPIPFFNDFPIFFGKSNYPLEVISDLDDTVIVTYASRVFKRIQTTGLTHPTRRSIVPNTKALLQGLAEKGARIHYVSKSETNLYHLLATFFDHNKVPHGPMYLTRYRARQNLFVSKKDPIHKLRQIRHILDRSPGKKFLLIGDDSQHDVHVYSEAVEEYPDRIEKVMIRQTGFKENQKLLRKLKHMKWLGVDYIYFKTDDDLTSIF